jgi:hypothetical protein
MPRDTPILSFRDIIGTMDDQPINRAEAAIRADQFRMVLLSLVLVAGAAYAAFRLEFYKSFRPDNVGLFWVSIAWFAFSAIETFNKRMGQIAVRGEMPPYAEYSGLHVPLLIVRYALLAYLLYIDWRWALTLYVLTLVLAVSPVLETMGKALMFLWLKKRID